MTSCAKSVELEFMFFKGYLLYQTRKCCLPILAVRCRQLKASIHSHSTEDEYFFMLRPGRAMSLHNVYHNFRRYLEKARISHTGHGPRLHDFRWTYCVNLLRKWVAKEKDLMAYIPYMRTTLGHESFEETAYYLKLTLDIFPSIRESICGFWNLLRRYIHHPCLHP